MCAAPVSSSSPSSSSSSSSTPAYPPSLSHPSSSFSTSLSLPSLHAPLPSSPSSCSSPTPSLLSRAGDSRCPDSRLPSHPPPPSSFLYVSYPAAPSASPYLSSASSMQPPLPPRPLSSPPPEWSGLCPSSLLSSSSSPLSADSCYPKKRCMLAASSHGKRSRELDSGRAGSCDAIDAASAQQLQLPMHVSMSSLSIQTTRSPSPSLCSPSHPPTRSTPSSPCPYSSLSPQSASLFSALASLPVHEFKSLICPLLPHLLAHDPFLPSLLLSRFVSRSRWQSMERNLLAKALSFLDLVDLLTVQSVSHHFRQHSTHQLVWSHLIYDAHTGPPVRSDRALQLLCCAMQRQRIPLTRMRLTGSMCSASGLSSLQLLQSSLIFLDLSCMGQVTDCSMLAVSKLTQLSTLLLNSTSISSLSIRYLRCLPFLTHLSVLYTHVDQTALPDLAYLPLTSLAICSSGMSSKAYTQLGRMPHLQRLQLGCLQAHSLYKLAHLQQVEELEFACITKGRGKVAAGVDGRDEREEREVEGGGVGVMSECALDLTSLGELKRLTTLNLGMGGDWSDMSITAASLEPLTLLPSLTHLQITSCPLLSNAHLATLAACTHLASLHLEGSMNCGGLASLAALPSLTCLHLTSPHIGDRGCATLSQLPLLTRLHLSHAHVTGVGVRSLRGAVALRWLGLECATLDDGCVEELRGLGGWVEVKLLKCVVTRRGWERVQERKGGATLEGCNVIMVPCGRAAR